MVVAGLRVRRTSTQNTFTPPRPAARPGRRTRARPACGDQVGGELHDRRAGRVDRAPGVDSTGSGARTTARTSTAELGLGPGALTGRSQLVGLGRPQRHVDAERCRRPRERPRARRRRPPAGRSTSATSRYSSPASRVVRSVMLPPTRATSATTRTRCRAGRAPCTVSTHGVPARRRRSAPRAPRARDGQRPVRRQRRRGPLDSPAAASAGADQRHREVAAQQGHRGVLEVEAEPGEPAGGLGDDPGAVVAEDGDGVEGHPGIMSGAGGSAQRLARREHRVQHVRGEPPGEGVLLAGVVAAEQQPSPIRQPPRRRARSAAAAAARRSPARPGR